MRLNILGPIELIANNVPVQIGGHRRRIVLSMMALNVHRVTSVERLIDAVWASDPPATARSQIQICVSGLRKVLDDSVRIETRPPGYLLDLGEGDLDSKDFDRLVVLASEAAEAGRPDAAITLRAALAMWRGPALVGVSSELVRQGATLLDDRRLTTTEECLRLELELGRHREITGELRAMVDQEPFRERLYGLLMLALYRSGRQTEALAVYREARTTLSDEIGVDPGDELQQLERAILQRDPPPAVAGPPERIGGGSSVVRAVEPVVPRQLPACISDFVGRDDKIAEIKAILCGQGSDGSRLYSMPIVTISGGGGIGKSSLAIRAAHELADLFPDGSLYANLGADSADTDGDKILKCFLRATGVPGMSIPARLDERTAMYRSRLAGRRLLVVLDDVQNESQILSLLPGSPTCAVIITSRARLSGIPSARSVGLQHLDADASVALLARIVGEDRVEAEAYAAAELVKLCGRLPLALRIAGARLVCRPHWTIGHLVGRLNDDARRLDELAHRGLEVRANIDLTYQSLPRQARRLFRLLAVFRSRDFPSWTAAALLDVEIREAEDVLETLVDEHLVEAVTYSDGRGIRYRFHDLIYIYAREHLLATDALVTRNRAVRGLLGAMLTLVEQAHRREYGGDFIILHSTADRWRPPSGVGFDLGADHRAWLESERDLVIATIRLAADVGLDDLCWDLALTALTLFETRDYFEDWWETTTAALAATERADNRRGRAAMLYSLGTLFMARRRVSDAEANLTTALDLFVAEGDRHGQALVLRNLAFVDRLQNRHDSMVARYDEALVLMTEVDDRIGQVHVLCNMAKIRPDAPDREEAREMLEEALVVSTQKRCRRTEAQVSGILPAPRDPEP